MADTIIRSNNEVIGGLFILAGIVLILYALGLFAPVLNTVIIIASIAMIAYGIFRGNFIQRIKEMRLGRTQARSKPARKE
jgi:hypothetical protein